MKISEALAKVKNQLNTMEMGQIGIRAEQSALNSQIITMQSTIVDGLAMISGPKSAKHTSLTERKGAEKLEKLLGESNYADWSFTATGFLTEDHPDLKWIFED